MSKTGVILLLSSFLAACVTINIYFPAAEAQKVADEIIDDVWQIKDEESSKTPAVAKPAENQDPAKTEEPVAE
jgi:hypothetical protein